MPYCKLTRHDVKPQFDDVNLQYRNVSSHTNPQKILFDVKPSFVIIRIVCSEHVSFKGERKMKIAYLSMVLITLLLSGCNNVNQVEQVQKSNLTTGMVKKTIIEGVTTQNEILEVFGAPNIITKNKSGNEVWTYDTISVQKSAEEGYWNVIVGGVSGGRSSTSTRTFTLMIEFDGNEVVKECSYRASAF